MSNPEAVLRAFGEQVGLPDLAFGTHGNMALLTESGRYLGIEQAGRGVLVYLAQPVPYDPGSWLLRAWKRAYHGHPAPRGRWPVQAALRQHTDGVPRLLTLACIPEDDFTPESLHQALDYLSRWLDTLHSDVR